jgi:integrative and conjugative element protein (TIGR02256 family)
MLDQLALELSDATLSGTASASFVTLPHAQRSAAERPVVFRWEPDQVSHDPHSGYEIRIAEPAWQEIIAWVKRSGRVAGPAVETGGLLFGERDDAVRVIWVSEISGPPRDSEAAEDRFVCGVEGVSDLNTEKRHRTQDGVKAIGVWHAHPGAAPLPSATDVRGMAAILDASRAPSARSLLLIIGHTTSATPTFGTFEFTRADVERASVGSVTRACGMQVARRRAQRRRVGLALSGGGVRAIAFHLGCLRCALTQPASPPRRLASRVARSHVKIHCSPCRFSK